MRFRFLAATFVCGACLLLFSPGVGTRARRHVQAVTGAVTPCDIEAVVVDRDPQGMNVRSGPGSSFKVIGNLPTQDVDGVSVHITGSQGDWVRIDRADIQGGDEERTAFKGLGWVYAPLLSVDGVGWVPGGTKIFKEPSVKSRVLARLPADGGGATVRGCRGKWTHLEFKKTRGWAAPGTTCANALTTCS